MKNEKNILGIITVLVVALILYPLLFQLAFNLLIKDFIGAGALDFASAFKLWLGLSFIKLTVSGITH